MKKALVVVLSVAMLVALCACDDAGYQHTVGNRVTSGSDVQTFNYAYISVGDKMIEGNVIQWRDYTNSDVVQVLLSDGRYYLTHYSNVILIYDPKLGGGNYSTGLVDFN